MKHKILLLSLLIFVLNSVLAQFGYLDKTFSSDGIAEINTGTQNIVRSNGVQVITNTDGSLLILFESSGSSFLLKKFASGITDSSYGMNGLSNALPIKEPHAARQSDGKIVIAGHSSSLPINNDPTTHADSRTTFLNEDFALARLNIDGSLDGTFGNRGFQTTDFNTYYDAINSIFIQPDGKILVSGITALYDPAPDPETGFYTHVSDRIALARYTNIGLPDKSFDGDGKVITNIHTNDLTSNLLALQTDGKFIVAGSDTTGLSLARYTSSGVKDNTYAFANKLVNADKSYFAVRSLAIQADNKIVLGGLWYNTTAQKDFVIIRFTTSSTLDKTFNSTGIQKTDFKGYNDYNTSLAIQNDGKIVAGGFASNGVSYAFATSRYNINGSVDNSYNADGKQMTYHGSGDLRTTALSVQEDQKIVLVGFTFLSNGFSTNTLIVRYNADGTLDKTFNKTGGLIYEFKTGNTVFTASVVQPDGKLISVGYTLNGTIFNYLVVRYKTNGTLDSTFSGDGIQITNLNVYQYVKPGVALQKDGKIILSGSTGDYFNRDFTLIRYNANGSLDNTFSGDGILISDFGKAEGANAVTVQADGKIVMVGSSDLNFAIARYNPDGSFDNSFANGGIRTDITLNSDETMQANSVAIDGNGKIVAGASLLQDHAAIVFRFNTNGSLDQSFSDDGIASRYYGYSDFYFLYSTQVIIQSDNKIIVAGDEGTYDREENYPNSFLLRYNTDGTVDNTFSEDGLTNPFPTSKFTGNSVIALQADGKIILSATLCTFWTYGYRDIVKKPGGYVMIRLKKNGLVDSTFGVNGIIYADSKPDAATNNITIIGSKLYAVGYSNSIGSYGYIAKYDLLTVNNAPKVSITSPANNKNFPATTTGVTVNVSATDVEGPVHSVKIYLNDSYIRTDFSAPYSFGLSGLTPGVYVVKAKATDNLGVETFSAPVTFTIGTTALQTTITKAITNTPVSQEKLLSPSAFISPNPAKNIINVSAKGFTKDGTMALLIFSSNGTMVKQIKINTKMQTISVDISTLQSGTYTLQLKSGDNIITKQFIKL